MKKWDITFNAFGKFVLAAGVFVLISVCVVAPAPADDLDHNTNNLPAPQDKGSLLGKRIMALQPNYVPAGLEYEDAVKHPIMYWRAWANQGLPLREILSIFLVILLPIQFIFPGYVARVRSQYEQHWGRSLGIGLLFLIFGGGICGFLARSGLYAPLATLLLGVVQLITLFGLCVACNSIGAGALSILRLDKRIEKSKFNKVVTICLGIFLVTCLMLVPGHRLLPGLGLRLIALIAAAGAGAVLVTMSKKDAS